MQTVTLTNINQNYDLATLLLAVSASERIHANSISIQAAPGNAADVLIGGSDMTATSFGSRLAPSDVLNLQSGDSGNSVHLNQFQARGEAAGLKLNITQNVL